ncbi:MAG TPA: ABC transporter substrate-binding protein [Verrucomicrobiae bacterium]|nr:ABC transporter substrate-binding protein [Verrucomicrobiae bacterium]
MFSFGIIRLIGPICLIGLISSSAHAAQSLEEVIIGYPSRSLTELPTHVALKKGFFRSEGLDVKLVQARSNILAAALASGSMHYLTSVTTVLGAIMGGLPAKVIAGVTKNNPDFLMVRPEIRSFADLKGKKVAVSGFGGASHQRMLIVLSKNGINPATEVTILSVGDARLRLDQLRAGAIDATVLTAPNNFIAERAGFKSLGSSSDLLALPAVGVATLERRLKEKPEEAKKILRSFLKGMRQMKEHREEAIAVAMEWLNLDRELAERSYDIMLPNYSLDGRIDPAALQASIDQLNQRRSAGSKTITPAEVTDFTLLEQVRKELKF